LALSADRRPIERAIAAADALGSLPDKAWAYVATCTCLAATAQWSEAERRSEEAITINRQLGDMRRWEEASGNLALIRTIYGRALLANGRPGDIDAAIEQLKEATRLAPEIPDAFLVLGMAHGRKGQDGPAALASAQYFSLIGDVQAARIQAQRVMQQYPESSESWRRARDIMEKKP
jgi:predicted Zn-dependent protease